MLATPKLSLLLDWRIKEARGSKPFRQAKDMSTEKVLDGGRVPSKPKEADTFNQPSTVQKMTHGT